MKELNILLATTQRNEKDAESLQNGLIAELLNFGFSVKNINQKSSKAALKRFFEISDTRNDLDVLICQEFLDEPLYPEDFEEIIKKSKSGLLIIEIVDEKKGSKYLENLLVQGIYNAVYTEDASIDVIAKRIAEPFSRKDAMSYYGSIQTVGSDYSNNANVLAQFIMSYNGTNEDLRTKVVQASGKCNSDVLLSVFILLPDEVLDRIFQFESFRQLADVAKREKEKRAQLEDMHAEESAEKKKFGIKRVAKEEKPKGKEKANKKDKKKSKKKGKDEENIPPLMLGNQKGFEVAFTATNRGVGSTYSALLCAFSLKNAGQRVAIVEFDNRDNNFMDLSRQVLNRRDVEGIMSYEFGGVDFYLNMTYTTFRADHRAKYDFVIYDFGCCSNEVIASAVLECERIFVVASPQEYKYAELMDFVNEVAALDIHREFIYLFPLCDEEMLSNLSGLIGTNRVASIPADRNPFCPSKETLDAFINLINNPEFPNEKKSGLSIDERLLVSDRQNEKKFTKRTITALAIGCAVLFLIALVLLIYTIFNTKSLKDDISSLKEYISISEDKLKASEEQIASYDRIVIVLKEPVTLGTKITKGMYELKTIKSNEPKEMFVTEEDIKDKYAACNIEEGIPIYHYYIADMAEPLVEESSAFVTEEANGANEANDED